MFAGQAAASIEADQLNQERQSGHIRAEAFHQIERRLRRAASRQQIVDDDDLLTFRDGIFVDLERVAAVLERVRGARVFDGSLPGLRTGTNPQPSRSATAAPKMKPRLSMPTTRSTPLPTYGAVNASIDALKPAGSRSSVVMS